MSQRVCIMAIHQRSHALFWAKRDNLGIPSLRVRSLHIHEPVGDAEPLRIKHMNLTGILKLHCVKGFIVSFELWATLTFELC